ncbi:MAG: AAA family ATPase [Anaerostipes sp.]|uniref:AAA family ATPase n=1 Tax=Anaerostipes sp. TaxID=1872530 RepID=UPI003994A6A0
MARKYGKKNDVKLDPLDYNIGLIGESGIGKTTLIFEVCEKLVGEDGYIFLETGKEDGEEAIQGIVSEKVREWEDFEDVCEDIIENKITDYKDLKIVVIDTFDQLVDMAKKEVIAMHNRENPEKQIKSIKQAFGGFMAGEDKALEIVLDKLWELKDVGVHFISIGHVKRKESEDPVTGETYSILTTDMSGRDFKKLQTKLHFLGVAFINREIIREKTGKKDPKTKKEITKNVVKSEARRITFRDDNYSVDSKSRFADIIDEIPLDPDEFIKALKDAILAERNKRGAKPAKEAAKEQKELKAKAEEVIAKRECKAREEKKLQEMQEKIRDYLTSCKDDVESLKPFIFACKELGWAKPFEVDNVEDAKKILELINK